MNTDDKAKSLVEKFKAITAKYVLNGEANEADILDEAKECAIISVDEIISLLEDFDENNPVYSFESMLNFWDEVKSKILSI